MTMDKDLWMERNEAYREVAKLRAEIERLRRELDGMWDKIAEWANEEGISFDATTRLSHALEQNAAQGQDGIAYRDNDQFDARSKPTTRR